MPEFVELVNQRRIDMGAFERRGIFSLGRNPAAKFYEQIRLRYGFVLTTAGRNAGGRDWGTILRQDGVQNVERLIWLGGVTQRIVIPWCGVFAAMMAGSRPWRYWSGEALISKAPCSAPWILQRRP